MTTTPSPYHLVSDPPSAFGLTATLCPVTVHHRKCRPGPDTSNTYYANPPPPQPGTDATRSQSLPSWPRS